MSFFNRVTIRDIAVRLGVSHVTVSLALRGHSRISKERRDQAQKMAREMGYRPDPMLSSLSIYRNRKRTVQIQSVLAWMNNWEHPQDLRKKKEFDAYWTGAYSAAECFGYRLEEFVWQPNYTPQRMETILKTRNIRGILIPPHPKQPDWGNFHWDSFSVIRFGLSVRSPDAHVISTDHLRSIMTAVEQIRSYGYKRIGFVVHGGLDVLLGRSETEDFVAAQRLLKLPNPLPLFISDQNLKTSAFRKQFMNWFRKNKPDAIMTSDSRLSGTLAHFKMRVPQDVAVATTAIFDPSVDTGVNQNFEEVGRLAVETIISLINANYQGSSTVPRRILLTGRWVDGISLPNRNDSGPVRYSAPIATH